MSAFNTAAKWSPKCIVEVIMARRDMPDFNFLETEGVTDPAEHHLDARAGDDTPLVEGSPLSERPFQQGR